MALAGAAVSIALGCGFIESASPTYDEPVHLASGYLGLVSGTPLNYRDHPPLAEMWAALPLLRYHLATLRQSAVWGRLYNYSDAFLYSNVIPADAMLDAARRWCLVSWSLLLVPAVVLWSAAFGTAAMAAAALSCAFCPPLLSNAALVTTDSAAAVFFFLTFWLCARRPRARAGFIWAGLAMGAAIVSKFNMIVLPGFLAATFLTEARLTKSAPLGWKDAALMGAASLLVVAAAYRFTDLSLYWAGLTQTVDRLGAGRSSFLGGAYSIEGSLLYFPAALIFKTPLPLLLCAATGLALLIKTPDVQGMWLVFPPAAFFVLACSSKTQIGYRHILPVFPFLIVIAARGAAWVWERGLWGRALCAALSVWLVASVARVQPDQLAYFNELAGGPDNGYRWLVDSNLDWGQGLKELGAELRRRGGPAIYLSYFGAGDPSYYGIRYVPAAFVNNVDRRDGVAVPADDAPVLLAVSATNLQGVYFADKKIFSWLLERRPVFKAGHSIFLYDLTADADGRAKLAPIVAASGGSPGALRRLALQ